MCMRASIISAPFLFQVAKIEVKSLLYLVFVSSGGIPIGTFTLGAYARICFLLGYPFMAATLAFITHNDDLNFFFHISELPYFIITSSKIQAYILYDILLYNVLLME